VAGDGPEFLVPLVRDAVRSVDVAAKRIDVDLAFLGDTAPAVVRDPASAPRGDPAPTGARER
jgi:hypothetical protein